MSDDGVARVDRAHELGDDPIGVDRNLRRAERRRPLSEPCRAHALQLGAHLLTPGGAASQGLDGLDELPQHESRVPQERIVGRVVLVEVALVIGGVDERLAGRDTGRHPVAGEATSDAEDHVGLAEILQGVPGHGRATGAECQRVILGERALGFHRGHDRSLEQVGQLEQIIRRLGVQHPLAGVNHRPPRLAKHAGRRLDLARIGAGRRHLDRPVRLDQGVGHVLVQDVGGDLDHRRARAAHAHHADGPAHDVRDLSAHGDGLDGLGHRRVRARRAEQGEDLGTVARMPERQEQHRRGIGVRGGHAGEGVLGPGAILHAEDGERLAVLHPRIAVGDPHAHSLLAAEHGPDVRLGRGLDHRGRWIGTQELGAFDLENAGDGIDDFHGCALL